MEIDRSAIDRLLKLNDTQLKIIIRNLAASSGIDPAEFNVDLSDISSIRRALGSVSDEELKQIAETYEKNKKR